MEHFYFALIGQAALLSTLLQWVVFLVHTFAILSTLFIWLQQYRWFWCNIRMMKIGTASLSSCPQERLLLRLHCLHNLMMEQISYKQKAEIYNYNNGYFENSTERYIYIECFLHYAWLSCMHFSSESRHHRSIQKYVSKRFRYWQDIKESPRRWITTPLCSSSYIF